MSRIFEVNDRIEKIAKDEKYVLAIERDENPDSPREWDNMTTMVCFHNKYNLGDSEKKHGYNKDMFDTWEELYEAIQEHEDPAIVRPLYLYDHSGITISMGRFSDHWDSGQIGFIFIRKKDVPDNYLIEKAVGVLEDKLVKILQQDVETYDQYLRGDIYGFIIEDVAGEEIDACTGFYGDDPEENGMKEHIDEDFHYLIDQLEDVR